MQSMNKEDKQGLLQGLGGSLLFSLILYLLSKDLLFAIALPFGFYLFWIVMLSALGQSWLVRLNEEEAIFRKPVASRIFTGAIAIALGKGIAYWVHLCLPGKHPQDTAMGVFGLIFLSLFEVLMVLSTGPRDTRFDFARGRISYHAGFPLLARTRNVDKSEVAAVRVSLSKNHGAYVYLKWKRSGRMSASIAQFETAVEAGTVAEQIGNRLALPVEVRDLQNVIYKA